MQRTTARHARIAAAAATLSAAGWVSAHWISLSPDARYSLAWGAELLRGHAPDLEAPDLSTPHPLPIAVGGMLSLLGSRAAADAYALLAALALALLAYGGYRLARALGGVGAGGLAVLLVLTRPRVDFFASRAFIDIPFAALVLLAAALAAEGPRANAKKALGLLVLAGLLRPEAWGLSVLYAGWLFLDARGTAPSASPARLGTLALAAPVIWIGFDLVLTGDPLHSLHGTQENAAALERRTGVEELLPALGDGLRDLAGLAPAAAGAGFTAWMLRRPGPERPAFAIAAATAVAGVAGFGALALADLPLNDRYLLVPALVLLAAAAAAVPRGRRSAVAATAAAVALVPAAIELPDDLREGRDAIDGAASKARADEDLERLLARSAVRKEIERCPRLSAAGSARAAVAALLERDPASVAISRRPIPPRGSATLSTSDTVAPGARGSVREGAWTFVTRC